MNNRFAIYISPINKIKTIYVIIEMIEFLSFFNSVKSHSNFENPKKIRLASVVPLLLVISIGNYFPLPFEIYTDANCGVENFEI